MTVGCKPTMGHIMRQRLRGKIGTCSAAAFNFGLTNRIVLKLLSLPGRAQREPQGYAGLAIEYEIIGEAQCAK